MKLRQAAKRFERVRPILTRCTASQEERTVTLSGSERDVVALWNHNVLLSLLYADSCDEVILHSTTTGRRLRFAPNELLGLKCGAV